MRPEPDARQKSEDLPEGLRKLVKNSVSILGQVIRADAGEPLYFLIERLRTQMAKLRTNHPNQKSGPATLNALNECLQDLSALPTQQQRQVATAYTLMLELMNACENAYRTYRLQQNSTISRSKSACSIVYVVTAHPTEARAPQNIDIFHQIQTLLTELLRASLVFDSAQGRRLRHLLDIAWRTSIVRSRKPKVRDECEHIYSIVLREDSLAAILRLHEEGIPFYLRSWVGGDKDGHPGVDQHTLLQSLNRSRSYLVAFALGRLAHIRTTLELLPSSFQKSRSGRRVLRLLNLLKHHFAALRHVSPKEGRRLQGLRKAIHAFVETYASVFGAENPELLEVRQLLRVFPGLVVPLELRESSDVVMTFPKDPRLAIARMLETVASLSEGGDPKWYARGFIISMAETPEHLAMAARIMKASLGSLRIPIVPLLEQEDALRNGPGMADRMFQYRWFQRAVCNHWNNHFEIMVGYSDSAKEVGVLRSRVVIAETIHRLEGLMSRHRVSPTFFHGSGGSVDRGGGSVQDQAAWWPESVLHLYKATLQGEMIERTFSSPEIMSGQMRKIASTAERLLMLKQVQASPKARVLRRRDGHRSPLPQTSAHKPPISAELAAFSERVAAQYQRIVQNPDFLLATQAATPYPFLSHLKMGSRPAKRGKFKSVASLRAIPWVLCWTQTRVLFPGWWGIGTAWKELQPTQRKRLTELAQSDPFFRSYLMALGFTLAKVELPIWTFYLKLRLGPALSGKIAAQFEREFAASCDCLKALTGHQELLWFRPWLATSIRLRAPMIHPLNLLQVLALKNKDLELLRITVAGISSGMMTTG